MIGILDYKFCNTKSIFETMDVISDNVKLITEPKQIKLVDKLIIPGVGSAFTAMKFLKSFGFTDEIREFVENEKFLLGICLGMQILFNNLSENGPVKGLGFFKSNVEPISKFLNLKTNIGWRKISNLENKKQFNIKNGNFFYFCHSYFVELENEENKFMKFNISNYHNIPAVIEKNNIIGFQFHPEKSQKNGIELLKHFNNL